MSKLGTQIRLARKEAGLNQGDLGRAAGVTQKTVSRWETGKGAPDVEQLGRICKATQKAWSYFVSTIDIDGAMMVDPTKLPQKGSGYLLVSGRGYFENTETGILKIYDDERVQAGAGPDGFGFEVFSGPSVEVRFYKQMMEDLLSRSLPDTTHGIRVAGHSMEPEIKSGQLVLYDPVEKLGGIISGKRYIISLYNEKTGLWNPLAKRIYKRDVGGYRIVSDNKAGGQPDTVLIQEADNLFRHSQTGEKVRMDVLGEVIWPTIGLSEEQRRVIADTLEVLASQGARQNGGERFELNR